MTGWLVGKASIATSTGRLGLRIVDCGLRIADCEFQACAIIPDRNEGVKSNVISDFRFQIAEFIGFSVLNGFNDFSGFSALSAFSVLSASPLEPPGDLGYNRPVRLRQNEEQR
jgi:hypothetical protein